eukprot:9485374-Pyramimonas_sp.AAC.1
MTPSGRPPAAVRAIVGTPRTAPGLETPAGSARTTPAAARLGASHPACREPITRRAPKSTP